MTQATQKIAFITFGVIITLFAVNLNQKTPPLTTPEDIADSIADAGFRYINPLEEQELLKTRTIIITQDINAHTAHSVIRKLLILNQRDQNTPINLYIRTEGGWVGDAFAIIDAIQAIDAPVNTHAIGETHSSGAMILITGTGQRIIHSNAIIGFHALDGAEEKVFADRFKNLWLTHSEFPKKWVEKTDDEFIYITPEEALTYKIADSIKSPSAE